MNLLPHLQREHRLMQAAKFSFPFPYTWID
jgi:hypothetical protein